MKHLKHLKHLKQSFFIMEHKGTKTQRKKLCVLMTTGKVQSIIFNWGTVANHDGAPTYGIRTIYFSSSFVFGSRRLSRTPITAESPMPLREKEPKERMAPPMPMVSVTEMMMMLRV